MKKQELVIKSREAMLSAVQIYNNPQITFKAESFITLAVISWTYLFHAYYANKGIEYRYYDQHGKRKHYHKTKYGAFKYWELGECLKNTNSPLDNETTNNLEFLIGIRHEIEHQMTNRIDETISAKLQACSINYNYYIKKLFGDEYGVDTQLGLAIQFSPISPSQEEIMLHNEKLATNIKNFISEFEENLSEEDVRNSKYAYRLLFTPLNANRKGQADQVIEFIKSGTEASENLNKAYTLIKETEKKKYRGKDIVELMHKKGYKWFNINKMTDLWKYEIGSRDGYGVEVTSSLWMWYENWIPVVENYCEKMNSEIDSNTIKNGYYPSEIVSVLNQKGFGKFTTNSFIKLWRDEMGINKDDTKYCYKMHNGRYVWSKEFLSTVEKYCEEHKDDFIE